MVPKLLAILVLFSSFSLSHSIIYKQFPIRSLRSTRVRSLNLHMKLESLRSKHLSNVRTVLQYGSAAALAVLTKPLSSNADAKLCVDDSISVLTSRNGAIVTLIGTAHISEESIEQVRRIIREQRPDTVMIELDMKRLGKIKSGTNIADYGFILPEAATTIQSTSQIYPQNSQSPSATITRVPVTVPVQLPVASSANSQSIVTTIIQSSTSFLQTVANNAAAALLGKALSQFYSNVEQMGFTAGGEFKAAFDEARKLPSPARVLLGDRDVDITLSRLADALSQTSPVQLTKLADELDSFLAPMEGQSLPALPGPDSRLTKTELNSFMERIKTRASITQMTNIMKTYVPALYNALLGERDQYMADAIATCSSKSLVGVVGFAHVIGMEKRLIEKGYTLKRRNCPL